MERIEERRGEVRCRPRVVLTFYRGRELLGVQLPVSNGVKPRSEIAGMKPPYVCPECFIHTYSNNMINRFHVQ
jgi:hypothetical protein